MKRVIFAIILMFLLCLMEAKAQVYDGITQPTKYRIWLPMNTSLENGDYSVSPFVGYRADATEWLSFTPVVQYNMTSKEITPQMWVNVDYKDKVYLLSRSIYDVNTRRYRHTLSTTIRLPYAMMIDATWENLNRPIDRLQIVGGWAIGPIVFNIGYSVLEKQGVIANLRFKITKYNWLQFRYDGGTNTLGANVALQF